MDEQVKCAAKGETGGMGRVLGTALGYDDVFLQHRTGAHPERPARLTSICEHLKRDGLWERLVRVGCRVEADGWIREVHSGDYIEMCRIRRFAMIRTRWLARRWGRCWVCAIW